MDFTREVWNKAKRLNKTITLPETDDIRILKAAELAMKSKVASIVLVGKEDEIKKLAQQNDIDISQAKIVTPRQHPKLDKYTQILKDQRQHRGMTIEKARHLLMDDYPYFAAMMVAQGEADGLVSGATHFTADTIRATVDCIGKAAGQSIISSFFVMVLNERSFVDDGILFFADCGVVPNPNPEQLADIALQTADSYKKLMGKEPRVAMLSFSPCTKRQR